MLFNIDKQKSLALIQILVAVMIIAVPSLLNLLSSEAAVYLLFSVLSLIFLFRIKNTDKVGFSPIQLGCFVLIIWGLLSFFAAKNTEGQFLYIFAIASVGIFSFILNDYYTENSDENFKRRISYLISLSGVICALYNVIFWITEIVPVAGENIFAGGLESNDFLGVYMALSTACTISLYKGNSKFRKFLFNISIFLMAFCFVMTKSPVSWVFALVFTVLVFLKKMIFRKNANTSKKYLVISLSLIFAYFISLLLFVIKNSGNTDVFLHALTRIFGNGGGFLSGAGAFSKAGAEASGIGLFPYMCGASGVLGGFMCVLVFIRSVIAFLKLKTLESAVGIIAILSAFVLPQGNNIAIVLLVIGLNAYNEYSAGMTVKTQTRQKLSQNIIKILSVMLVLTFSSTVLSLIEMKADSNYNNQKYADSYELYKTVSTIDVFESSANRMAAKALLGKKSLSDSEKEDALRHIDRAIRNDRENLLNYEIKAEIYSSSGDFEMAAQQYRNILGKAFDKEQYHLPLVESLYELSVKYPKGSSETKRIHEEILQIARSTTDLDIKKELIDIADKVFLYTKGDLKDESQIIVNE